VGLDLRSDCRLARSPESKWNPESAEVRPLFKTACGGSFLVPHGTGLRLKQSTISLNTKMKKIMFLLQACAVLTTFAALVNAQGFHETIVPPEPALNPLNRPAAIPDLKLDNSLRETTLKPEPTVISTQSDIRQQSVSSSLKEFVQCDLSVFVLFRGVRSVWQIRDHSSLSFLFVWHCKNQIPGSPS
jgi:hypothetical protein